MIEQRDLVKCIILSVVTCGIYGILWMLWLADDTNTLAGDPDATPGSKVVIFSLVTCGIYMFYWIWKQGEKMDQITGTSNSGLTYLLLSVFGLWIVAFALMQDSLNKNA